MRPVCADTQHGECIVCMFHALVKFYELCCELFALYEQHASHIVCIQATCVYTHIEQLPGLYLFNVFCFSQAAFLLVFIFCVLFVCVSFMSLSAITFMCARCVTSYTFTHFAFSFLSIHLQPHSKLLTDLDTAKIEIASTQSISEEIGVELQRLKVRNYGIDAAFQNDKCFECSLCAC